jgi:flagellar L-ring protein precursor FlgH
MKLKLALLLTITTFSLTACGAADRISSIGEEPAFTSIEDPTLQKGYQPVSLPMPAPEIAHKQPNSLWASNRKNFFKDQRAGQVGDILTVVINIRDQAELDNETEKTRASSENAGLDSLLGYETKLGKIFPDGVNPATLAGAEADSNYTGTGSIEREEEIDIEVAALVTQILPNGNMVIHGKQEVRVNFEKRIVAVDGVIRPEDISIQNTIQSNQIAEARIAYGGEGHLTDVQQPRYGQQFYDVVFPF